MLYEDRDACEVYVVSYELEQEQEMMLVEVDGRPPLRNPKQGKVSIRWTEGSEAVLCDGWSIRVESASST